MYKTIVIENKRKKNLERRQRLNAFYLRNKLLGEWVAATLGFDEIKKRIYIKKTIRPGLQEEDNKYFINKIEKDFIRNNIKINYKEIELKVNNFQIKANIIVENKFKLNNRQ